MPVSIFLLSLLTENFSLLDILWLNNIINDFYIFTTHIHVHTHIIQLSQSSISILTVHREEPLVIGGALLTALGFIEWFP